MRASIERVRGLLETGEIELLGLLPGASNYTFAVNVSDGEGRALAVYKPREGERPLWDFPEGTLWAREVAAYEISLALGWDLVPPTVARDGPHGMGSLQVFVDAEPEAHYFTLMPGRADDFRRVAAFDLVVNNADRKAGHCLLERATGRIRVIDHGVCFHAEPKLRTVIWDFAGEAFPGGVLEALERARDDGDLLARLSALLAPEEVEAMHARTQALLAAGHYPEPPSDRRSFPWPPV